MIMSGKYYPNKWKAIKRAPAELFETLSFEEFIDWKFHNGLDLTNNKLQPKRESLTMQWTGHMI